MKLICLVGLTKRVQKIFKKIRKRVDKAISKLLRKAKKAARKLFRKNGKKKSKKEKEIDSGKGKIKWWKVSKGFKGDDGNKHKLYYDGKDNSARLMVASNPEEVSSFLTRAEVQIKESKDKKVTKLSKNVSKARKLQKDIDKLDNKINSQSNQEKKEKMLAALKSKIAKLSTLLDPLTIVFKQEEYPPTALPPFANGVKATGFTAEYISTKELDTGEESTAHSGNLPGWQRIKDEDLTTSGPRYVKMHLLSEALGGKATDSNLTPAPGPTVNVPFASGIERPAYNDLKSGKYERIWYKLSISYHASDNGYYPKKISASYGNYTKEGGKYKKVKVSSYSKSMAPPFKDSVFKINNMGYSGAQIALAIGVSTKLGNYIYKTREKFGTFKDSSAVVEKLNQYKNSNSRIKLSSADIATVSMALAGKKGKISYKK